MNTFRVSAQPARDVFTIGTAAVMTVTVVREINGHVIGPAEQAQVMVGLDADRFLAGAWGVTGGDGRVRFTLPLTKQMPTGPVDVTVMATHEPVHCVQEYGEFEAKGFFRIRR